MPTEPAEIPKWADTETPATPSAGQQNAGWSTIPIPSYDTFNWLGKWAGRWVTWLKAWYAVEHNSDGRHTTVHVVTSLKVDSGAPIAYELGIGTPSSREQWIDLGNPSLSPWVIRSGTPVLNPTATPPNTSVAAGGTVVATRDVTDLIVGVSDSGAGDQWVAVELGATAKRVNAGDALTITLYSVARAGTGAETLEATHTKATNGAYQNTVTAINVAIDPSKFYLLRATITMAGGSAAGDAALCNARIGVNRLHLE